MVMTSSLATAAPSSSGIDVSKGSVSAMAAATDRICIGWVDTHSFTRECITNMVAMTHENFIIIPFESVEDCVRYSAHAIDLIVYHSHESDVVKFADIIALREAPHAARVIVLSDATRMGPGLAREILMHGSSGVVLTNSTNLRMVISALGLAASGGIFVPNEFLVGELKPETEPRPSPPWQLTQREVEVLSLLRQGKTNRSIAGSLSLSVNTTKVHVRNVISKMGARNRTEAAMNSDRHPSASLAWNPMVSKK